MFQVNSAIAYIYYNVQNCSSYRFKYGLATTINHQNTISSALFTN